ncbi:MAG: hypothetical protein ACJASX_002479 [Limisphaerales bacterium]|jgi:hypothetical protein
MEVDDANSLHHVRRGFTMPSRHISGDTEFQRPVLAMQEAKNAGFTDTRQPGKVGHAQSRA